MTPAKLCFSLLLLSTALVLAPTGAAARHARAYRVAMDTPNDVGARHRSHRVRHATPIHIYQRGDYSFFEPYAPPVPLFFPFGYRQGYF